jgi:hypothetical protein
MFGILQMAQIGRVQQLQQNGRQGVVTHHLYLTIRCGSSGEIQTLVLT